MAFDPERFARELIYTSSAPASRVLVELEQVRAFDRAAEEKLARLSAKGMVSCFVVVGAFGLAIATGVLGRHGPILLPAGLVVLLIGLLVFLGLWSSAARLDVEDARYELAEGVLKLLAVDLGAEEELSIKLDLEPRFATHKQTRRETHRGRYRVQFSSDPWFMLSGRFLDGTRFRLGVNQDTELRTHAKGHKVKEKVAITVTLDLRPKAKRYAHLAELGTDVEQALQFPEGVAVKRCAVAEGTLSLRVGLKRKSFNKQQVSGSDATVAELVPLMFLNLYQVLNLSRRMTRREG